METTRLSTKGQIILPKAIRTSKAWQAGTEFFVEEVGEGVLLRPARRFPRTQLTEVAGLLKSPRKAGTPAQMRDSVVSQVIRRHDSGRY